ncbi:lipopolysaccharide assembly LapA domain-containing protein [Peribacillus sp. SCS-26]|uniref:LapA family protein n=1 Tax=Paraperibacillus marinus TaxID=3115295 RepID=UPI00390605A9
MKTQWTFIIALAFALVVAVFAVVNVDSVTVNYVFGTSRIPLILVILSSAFMGGIIAGSLGLIRVFSQRREIRRLKQERDEKEVQLELAERQTPAQDGLEEQEQTVYSGGNAADRR